MIADFQGPWRFLSNFWIEPDGTCVEREYQGAKSNPPTDLSKYSPGLAKTTGKTIPLRSDWEKVKDRIMYDFVLQKFQDHPELAKKLLNTGNQELQEGNYWGDRYWGISPAGSGIGENRLGKILMRVREKLRG